MIKVTALPPMADPNCPLCEGSGLNFGAQLGPGPGYQTISCKCVKTRAEKLREAGFTRRKLFNPRSKKNTDE